MSKTPVHKKIGHQLIGHYLVDLFRWSELILQKDQLVFGSGNNYYQQIHADTLTLPTEAEVQGNIEIARRRRGTNPEAQE